MRGKWLFTARPTISIRPFSSVLLLGLSLLPLITLAFSRILIIDDAFITYRYAYHLSNGDGLVFNPGERVEGSTSLLWTVLLALPISRGWPIDRWAAGLGVGFALLASLITWRIIRLLGLSSFAAITTLLILACLPGYWLVAANGMEGGLTSLLLATVLLCAVTRRYVWTGIFGGLLFMARPDSAAVLPLCALYLLGHSSATWRRTISLCAFRVLVPWFFVVGAVTLWRLNYYAAWLPNTVTAKSPPNFTGTILEANVRDGLLYYAGFLLEVAPLAIGGLIGLIGNTRRIFVWLCLALLAAQLPAILINGGDWIPHHRLLMVEVPVLAILCAFGVEWLIGRGARYAFRASAVLRGGLCLALVCATILPLRINNWETAPAIRINQQGVVCTDYRALALALQPALISGDRLAPEALGIFGYILRDTYMHDFLGLTDRYLAENGTDYWPQIGKSDLGYTYSTIRPTLFIFHSGPGFPNDLFYQSQGTLEKEYAAYTLKGLKSCPPGTTILVIRRDSLDRLLPAVERFLPQPLTLGVP